MSYQVFSYLPSSGVATTDPPPRPIRVTPSALSPLLYAILYSIEFQSPVGPRPAALRDHSSGRASGGGSGGGGGVAPPSAAALLTSAVSAMSSFWGRTAATATTSTQQQQQQQQQGKGSPSVFGAGATTAGNEGTAVHGNASLSPPRAMTAAEEAELAALLRQHEQPFVVPVTQVLHKLGGVHITVRETHNATITTAYARAMEEVEEIVSEHEQRLARLLQRSSSFPSHPGMASATAASTSPSAVALAQSGGTVVSPAASVGAEEAATANVYPRAQLAMSPASPTSPSRSMVRVGSPLSGRSAAGWAAASGPRREYSSVNSTSAHTAGGNVLPSHGSGGGRLDDFAPGQDEVGLVLSVRLLSKEVTRWRLTHERPLAEWRFPIIRTSSERMMMLSRAQSPAFASSSAASSLGGGGSLDGREMGGDGGSAAAGAPDVILVNDAAQMHQVLEFILKSSYQTTSMETFTDFTSGELVFDAHVQERRRFV